MKLFNNILLLLFVFVTMSCKEDGYVRIDTLSKYGDRFYQGQVVPLWVGVDVNDREKATYKWECSAGSFQGPTNVFRAAWVAPMEKGEYTVTCTVSCDGTSDTRITKMVVDEFFFDNFGVPSKNFTSTYLKATYQDGEVLICGSKSNRQGSYTYSINQDFFVAPFSFSFDAAWRKTYKNMTTPFVANLEMKRMADSNGVKQSKYIKSIDLYLYPKASVSGINYRLTATEYNVSFGKSTTVTIAEGYLDLFSMPDGNKAEDKKGMKNFNVEVDFENTIIIKVNSKEALKSTFIKDWEKTNKVSNIVRPLAATLKAYDRCNMYIDNFYLRK